MDKWPQHLSHENKIMLQNFYKIFKKCFLDTNNGKSIMSKCLGWKKCLDDSCDFERHVFVYCFLCDCHGSSSNVNSLTLYIRATYYLNLLNKLLNMETFLEIWSIRFMKSYFLLVVSGSWTNVCMKVVTIIFLKS